MNLEVLKNDLLPIYNKHGIIDCMLVFTYDLGDESEVITLSTITVVDPASPFCKPMALLKRLIITKGFWEGKTHE